MPAAVTITAVVVETVFLIWFILPVRFRVFKAGNLLGILICLTALFRTALSSVYHRLESFMIQYPVTKVLWIIVTVGCIAFAVYAVCVSICMVIAMKIRPDPDAVAVILGAQVKPWGASRLLKQRIVAARNYLENHPQVKAAASGGQGINEPMSEAACIQQELVKSGVDPDRILVEDRSVNTEQNLLYSIALIKEKKLGNSIATVTDSYHQLRARIIAYKTDRNIRVGACNTVNTKIGILVYPSFFVREWIAIPVEIFKKPGQPARHRKL